MSLRGDLTARTRIVTDLNAEVQRILREGRSRIQGILDAQPTDFERWQLERIHTEIKAALERIAINAGQITDAGITDIARHGALMIDNAVHGAGWGTLPPTIDSALLKSMRAFTTHKIRDITLATADRLNTQIGLTLIGAIDRHEARREIGNALKVTQQRAQTVLYHESARVYSAAAQERLEQVSGTVPGLQKRWVKSLKRMHPRLNHAIIHGQTVDWDEPFELCDRDGNPIEMMYPHDPAAPIGETIHCGCVAVPVVPGWEDTLDATNVPGDEAEKDRPVRELLDMQNDKLIQTIPQPERADWGDFPAALIAASENAVKQHIDYASAKGGNIAAAVNLVEAMLNVETMAAVRAITDRSTRLVPVRAVEGYGVNVIPIAMAATLRNRLGLSVATGIIQVNRVGHTGASGYHRLATPALFGGPVEAGKNYLLLDDFIGQGGTFANLRGHIEAAGGHVVGALALTGKPHSAILRATPATLSALRAKHGPVLEKFWRDTFGHGLGYLSESEARYLLRSEDVDTIRANIARALLR